MPLFRAILAGFLANCLTLAHADEGMWTFDNFPSERVAKAYGFKPDQRWLDRVQRSSVRFAHGCSGAFVSPSGLVQTNHHCIRTCIQQLSTDANDLNADGFYARTLSAELKCPDLEVNQLISIIDVTAQVRTSTDGLEGAAFVDTLNSQKATIARHCSGNDVNIRCDVVDLYQGALYHVYKYRRYQDLPEDSIANFGGDTDNFEFPRHSFDVAYVRVYRNGRPLDSKAHYLRYAKADARARELTFTAGHPAETNRLDTVADLEFRRDVMLPRDIGMNSELRELLIEFSTGQEERARIARDTLLEIENTLKGDKGRLAALVDPAIIRSRALSEQTQRAIVATDISLQKDFGAIWDNVRSTREYYRSIRDRYAYTEYGYGFRSQLFDFAKSLVRYAAEAKKPDEARLPEFTESSFPETRQKLLSTAPVYPELEKLTLTFSLTKLRNALGQDDAFVIRVLNDKSPAERAAELVNGTRLSDANLRATVLEAGQTAIDSSTDTMIAFVRAIDPDLRSIRKDYDSNVDGPLTRSYGQLARLLFRIGGTSIYPDGTSTLRLSYGAVLGYQQDGRTIEPMTTLGGLFARATGSDPYQLPDNWISARRRMNLRQPLNFVANNDIVGGNSGSPVINRSGNVVGLLFDGNIQSLGGEYGYDGSVNRAIAINIGAIREALAKVYRAERLLRELAK